MSVMPFVCAISGEHFNPEDGGQCSVCRRLVHKAYLQSSLFQLGKAPVCVDCLQQARLQQKAPGKTGGR